MAQSQQIASLSSKVAELAEVNKTLKTYLESVMTSSSPEESRRVIETESSRLDEFQKIAALRDNALFRFFRNEGAISEDNLRKIFEEANKVEQFEERIKKETSISSSMVADLFSDSMLQTVLGDINECRRILSVPPLQATVADPSRRRAKSKSSERG